MRFVSDGPDIPDSVLRTLEEDRLVLFCGAGISMPAKDGEPGLPAFHGLVEKVRDTLPASWKPDEKQAFDTSQYDRVLHLLEARFGRTAVRKAVLEALTTTASSAPHEALLELARLKDGSFRLVTTNFDPLFDDAASKLSMKVPVDVGPLLPVPKPHKWRSLAYIHGKIPPDPHADHPAVHALVYTSGDFGLAYLTERWASRFVTELFRTYSVLFVGYSVSDPVMRYLLDAIAADKQAESQDGRLPTVAWALASYEADEKRESTAEEWRAKGVEPILYKTRPSRDHGPLRETLSKWADQKRFGLTGRIKIAETAASLTPVAPYEGDTELDAIRWALKEDASARRFADLPEAPPVEWLPLLESWGMLGLQRRSAPSKGSVANTSATPEPDWVVPVSRHMLVWLTRHLDKPQALEWVVRGGLPHPMLQECIRDRLAMPRAAPGVPATPKECSHLSKDLEAAWRIVADPEIRAAGVDIDDADACFRQLGMPGGGPLLERHIVRMLTPVARLKRDTLYRAIRAAYPSGAADSVRDHLAIEVTPACGDKMETIARKLRECPDRNAILASIADDITSALKRALDLFALVGDADAENDPGRGFDIRPTADHTHFGDWLWLVELARDAMEALRATRPEGADALLARWLVIPYPTFKRLAFDACRSLI